MSRVCIIQVFLVSLTITSLAFAGAPRNNEEKSGEKKLEIPKGSKKVVELKDEGRYEAPSRGGAWLVDAKNNEVVAEASLRAGDVFAFNAKEDHTYINGEKLEEKSLKSDHTYQIWFLAKEEPKADKPKSSGRPVPDTAKVVMEGRDKELSFVARSKGSAYLYDASHDQLVEVFNMAEGDRITISPKSNAIALNGKTISRDTDLDRRVTYKLLFDSKK